ncbi:MAG: hypothetical protein KAQ70_05850, partial [Candidatus Heimdallarchaeota archaeon]|nr:hypothetical protein [Candidatus Heimdallarchaeota archaeon]
MASSRKKENNESKSTEKTKRRKSFLDVLYIKLLRDPSTNLIIVIVTIVFILWMVIPLFLVLSGGVYFNGVWSTQPITNVFTDPVHFNFPGDNTTQLWQLGEQEIGGASVSVIVRDNLVYVAERGGGIEIIDITNLDPPTEVIDYYDEVSYFTDMEIQGDYLYTAAGKSGLVIFDISDISDTFLPVSFLPDIFNSTDFLTLDIDNNLVYLDNDNQGFSIIDVSEVTDPQILSTISIETDSKGIAISGDYAYLFGYSTGIIVYDVSDPSDPIEVNSYDFEASIGTIRAQDIKIVGNSAYVALGLFGFAIFDISDPLSISLLGYKSDIKSYGVDVLDDYSYLTIRDDIQLDYGFTVLDTSNFSDISEISYYNTTIYRTQDIFIDEASNQIFLAQEKGGLHIIDSS